MMSDRDLLDILENGGEIAVPYFNGNKISIFSDDISPEEALEPLTNFLQLTNQQRVSDSRHLVAYCKFMVYAVGEEILEDMGGVQPEGEEIWDHVKITHIFLSKLEAGKYASEPTIFVETEANVAWEPEHGLQMSWANGNKLVKVSAFDGHPTNGHASAKPEDDKYVFCCYDSEFATLPD